MAERDVPNAARDERFVKLFLAHERQIFGFILTLVPHWHDADDLLQETTSTLWEKFDDFEAGTSFRAWALSVARFKVLNYRKKEKRARLRFGDACCETLVTEWEEFNRDSDARSEALQGCLKKLEKEDRDLVRLRYQEGATTAAVAAAVGRSANAVYKVLNRIHRQLLFCVRQSLAHDT